MRASPAPHGTLFAPGRVVHLVRALLLALLALVLTSLVLTAGRGPAMAAGASVVAIAA